MKRVKWTIFYIILLSVFSVYYIKTQQSADEKRHIENSITRLKQKFGFIFTDKKMGNTPGDFTPVEWNLVDLLTIEAIAEQLKTKKQNNIVFYKTDSAQDRLIRKISDKEYVISSKAFPYSFVPAICKENKNKCERVVYYTNELFKSYIEIFHNKYEELKAILKDRYNIIAITPPKEIEALKKALVPGTSAIDYQKFSNQELIWLIGVLEDLPKNVRDIKELKYLLRLKNGEVLPAGAPAISYPTLGYIAFADKMFNYQQQYYSEWLITHEIAHFYWYYKLKFDDRLEWAGFSKWYPAKEPKLILAKNKKLEIILQDNSTSLEYLRFLDKSAFDDKIEQASGNLLWSHETSEDFVSEYAARINPGEDFAESFASFVVNSKLLKSKSMKKYNFIKRLFVSYEYEMEVINDRYKFYIYQKNPDLQPPIVDSKDLKYVYTKTKEGDLEYTFELKAFDDLSGIKWVLLGFISPNSDNPQEYMLYLNPTEDNLLKGSIKVSRYSQRGDYLISRFFAKDNAGNETYIAYNKDKIRIKIATETDGYPPPSASIEKLKFSTKQYKTEFGDGTKLYVSIPVSVSMDMNVNAVLRLVSKQGQMFDKYGVYEPKTKIVSFEFEFSPFYENGEWYFRMLSLYDDAQSNTTYNLEKYNYKVYIHTSLSDSEAPVMKEDSLVIKVYEDDPVNHDSFVDVVFTFDVKDNLSGFSHAYFTIRKPSGNTEGYYYITEYYNEKNPRLDPEFQKWKTHNFTIRFPRHTESGWYELISVVLYDKVNNKREYNFTIRKIKARFNIIKSK